MALQFKPITPLSVTQTVTPPRSVTKPVTLVTEAVTPRDADELATLRAEVDALRLRVATLEARATPGLVSAEQVALTDAARARRYRERKKAKG